MDLTIPRVLMWQFVVGTALAAFLWVAFGSVAGYSALLGSLTCVIPNAFLGLRIMAPRRDPGTLRQAAWIGETGKIALTVLLFMLVFTQVEPLSAAALFAGFIASQMTVISGLLMRGETERNTENTNGS
jgi:ATP synthase protein I